MGAGLWDREGLLRDPHTHTLCATPMSHGSDGEAGTLFLRKVDNGESKGLCSFLRGAGASRLGYQGSLLWGKMEEEGSVIFSDAFRLYACAVGITRSWLHRHTRSAPTTTVTHVPVHCDTLTFTLFPPTMAPFHVDSNILSPVSSLVDSDT